uniref:Uncharacterized protein n=1 Tax=Arundo donax TaxID=35708 RepID=A0A0A9AAG4_ARUDO
MLLDRIIIIRGPELFSFILDEHTFAVIGHIGLNMFCNFFMFSFQTKDLSLGCKCTVVWVNHSSSFGL